MSPVTGAIRDTSVLVDQMKNLGVREKAGSSGKRVNNGADSPHDSQVCLATKTEISKILYFTFSLKVSSLIPH